MSQKTEQNSNLKHAILLISSLISLSRSVKVLASRWRSIRTKLDGLYSDLSAIDNCVSGENLLPLSIVVDSIISTLTTCEDDVARPCLDSTFTGKLRTQSDLDAVASKLDAHAKSLSDIYAVGLRGLSHGQSVSRDDVGLYVGDLLCRLRIGCADAKKRALADLNDVVREDERSAKIALKIDGFANSLVNLLDSPVVGIPEETCRSVSAIAGFQTCRGALIGAGIIAPLIRVLESGTELGKENAARCLMKFTEHSDHAWAVSAQGGVPPLLKIIRGAATELIVLACGVLKNLSGVEEIKRFMIEKGAVFDLIELLKSNKHESTKICSLDLLLAMAHRDDPVRESIILEGGIREMVNVLDPKMLASTKEREVALRGITSICLYSEKSIGMLMSCSFTDHVLYFLREGEISTLKAVMWLCGASEEVKKAMGVVGFMEVLVRFLDLKSSYEVRELACEALTSLLVVSKNRKRFAQSEEGIGVLMRMLEVNGSNKKMLLSMLMVVGGNSSARRKIVRSGCLGNVERLSEADGEAKKLARKMSYSNRFQSILSGTLWHS